MPVAIPERLNRDEIVLTGTDGALSVLDGDRWAAPLSDEIRQSVDDALWRRLRAADVYLAPVPLGVSPLPQYRLAIRVERFDAVSGGTAVVEAAWTLRRLPQGVAAVCRASFAAPWGKPGVDGAVDALAVGTAQMADAVAGSLWRLHQGSADPCTP